MEFRLSLKKYKYNVKVSQIYFEIINFLIETLWILVLNHQSSSFFSSSSSLTLISALRVWVHTLRLLESRQSGVAVRSYHWSMAHDFPLLLACVLPESSNILYFGFKFFENCEAESEFFSFFRFLYLFPTTYKFFKMFVNTIFCGLAKNSFLQRLARGIKC